MFIGTAGSAPTARRGLPSTLVRRGGDRLLFDCGEGTQRQLLRSIGLLDLEEIFLTHFHADHFLGLPGMLKTFGLRGREAPLTIYGPPGLRALFELLRPVIGGDRLPRSSSSSSSRTSRSSATATSSRRSRCEHRDSAPTATCSSRRTGPAASTRRARASSGSSRGPDFGRLQHGEAVSVDGRAVRPRRSWGSRGAGASSC